MRRFGLSICMWIMIGVGCSEQQPREAPQEAPQVYGVKDYLGRAYATVDTLKLSEAKTLIGDPATAFIDVREGNELANLGKIPGAVHVPRGFLEFYIDKTGAMHHEVFSSGKKLIFYCETGGRSVLSARLAKDMGLDNVAYLGGGFTAWEKDGGEVEKIIE